MTSKQLLYVVIFTFIVALLWVTSNVIHSQKEITIPPGTQELMEPINPNFDTEILNEL